MERTLARDIPEREGKEVTLKGWADTRRDHGKLVFIDLRDRSGIVQVVLKEEITNAGEIRGEDVIEVRGIVKARPAGMVNEKLPHRLGYYEVQVTSFTFLNQIRGEGIPIPIQGDGYEVNEETRMLLRYLDLRRARLQKNLRHRANITQFIRNFLAERDFTEIETPILTKSTPEGARDYLVPSRIEKGWFYALPQSPQQYKQLLMVAGFERYFQIARCFRDEDTRGDRQPEFTQLDLEMSFVEREDVMALNEEVLIAIVEKLYPEKKIQEKPFPRLTYAEAMEKYSTDRPDLRNDKNDPNLLAFAWIVDFPFFEKTDKGGWTFTHNPFSAPKEEFMEDLLARKNIGDILTSQYDVILNGWEIGGGSIRNHTAEGLIAVLNIIGHKDPQGFKHMFDALARGAPPHGGIAWGLDRLVMILENEPNIREVIAFPKTGDGRDLMMRAPSEVVKEQLDELGLEIKKESAKKKNGK
ncbi:MAG: aspartate--tRNA ligase [Candidatus Brennerbacteria bacterium]|nr:aspartate--tRNA ligase [Candidatus Brennerbacteria bacterium]